MEKTEFQILKNIHDHNERGYALISDNELMFDSKGDSRKIIFDEENDIIHAVSINPTYHYDAKYPAQVISTHLSNIQYIESTFTVDELVGFLTGQGVDDDTIKKIISKLV